MCPPPKVASGERKPRFSLVACEARDRSPRPRIDVDNRGAHGAAGLERVMGIEPTLVAWEATVLPLNYTRARTDSMQGMWRTARTAPIVEA